MCIPQREFIEMSNENASEKIKTKTNKQTNLALVAANNVTRSPRAPLRHFAVGLLTAASARRLLARHNLAWLADTRRATVILRRYHTTTSER